MRIYRSVRLGDGNKYEFRKTSPHRGDVPLEIGEKLLSCEKEITGRDLMRIERQVESRTRNVQRVERMVGIAEMFVADESADLEKREKYFDRIDKYMSEIENLQREIDEIEMALLEKLQGFRDDAHAVAIHFLTNEPINLSETKAEEITGDEYDGYIVRAILGLSVDQPKEDESSEGDSEDRED